LNYQVPDDATRSYPELNKRMAAFGSGHSGGANFAFADGSVKFVANEVDEITYSSLSTRDGGETIFGDY
jgi:prepilin-type processing-associated H-X9-DG protein